MAKCNQMTPLFFKGLTEPFDLLCIDLPIDDGGGYECVSWRGFADTSWTESFVKRRRYFTDPIASGTDFMGHEGLEPPNIWAMGLMQYISPLNNWQTWQC